MSLFLIENALKSFLNEPVPKLEDGLIPVLKNMNVVRAFDANKAQLNEFTSEPKLNEIFLSYNNFNGLVVPSLLLTIGNNLWAVHYDKFGPKIVVKVFDSYTFEYVDTKYFPLPFDECHPWLTFCRKTEDEEALWIVVEDQRPREIFFLYLDINTGQVSQDTNPSNFLVHEKLKKNIEKLRSDSYDFDFDFHKQLKLKPGPFVNFYQKHVWNDVNVNGIKTLVQFCDYTYDCEKYKLESFFCGNDIKAIVLSELKDKIVVAQTLMVIFPPQQSKTVRIHASDGFFGVLKIVRRSDGSIILYNCKSRKLFIFS